MTHLCILSTSALTLKGATVGFDHTGFAIRHSERTIVDGHQNGSLYWLVGHQVLNAASSTASASLDVWHQCMGHMSKEALKRYAHEAVKGLNITKSPVEDGPCHGCELGKSTHLPFPPPSKHAQDHLEIIHSNLVGPMQNNSMQGNKYFAMFLDDFSKVAVVVYMKSKDQFKQAFLHYKAWAELQIGKPIKCLHSDHGGKYVNNDLKHILKEVGIEHKLTMPYSPQQNGRAKHFNHTVMEKGTSMLHHAGLSLGFWETAVNTAVHIYNRTPSHSNKWKTPLELWDGTVPDISYLRVFGCKAYYHVPEHKRCKLDPKSREAVFVGYEPLSKGYTLWDRHNWCFISS